MGADILRLGARVNFSCSCVYRFCQVWSSILLHSIYNIDPNLRHLKLDSAGAGVTISRHFCDLIRYIVTDPGIIGR